MEPENNVSSLLIKLKRYALPAVLLVGVLIGLWIVLNVASSTLGISSNKLGYDSMEMAVSQSAPGMPSMGRDGAEFADALYYDEGGYLPPVPSPTAYVQDLEKYETTDYYLTARTRQFDEACDLLVALKARDDVDFRSIQVNPNNCSASFYAEEARSESVLEELEKVSGVEINRSTESVTRHRDQLKNRGVILREQLSSVEKTLSEAERQYDEITEVARASSDASALTEAIRFKLQMMDDLNMRRINLTSQLQQLSQQAADLEERIGIVAFSVNFSRSHAVDSNWAERKWEMAWKELRETVTEVLIGFSAYLGIFLMRAFQYVVYGLILVVAARFLWKLVRKIWIL